MLGICSAHDANMHGIGLKYNRHMLGMGPEYLWCRLGIVWHVLGIYSEYAWQMLGMCSPMARIRLANYCHMLDTYWGICMEYAWRVRNMLGI